MQVSKNVKTLPQLQVLSTVSFSSFPRLSDNINRRVCVFSIVSGDFLGVLSTGLDGQLEGLIGLCVARDSVVYVCNFYLNCILMFSELR